MGTNYARWSLCFLGGALLHLHLRGKTRANKAASFNNHISCILDGHRHHFHLLLRGLREERRNQ